MIEKLEEVRSHHEELGRQLSDPAVVEDRARHREVGRKYAELSGIVSAYDAYLQVKRQLEDARELAGDKNEDADIREMARQEIIELQARLDRAELEVRRLLVPPDPNDEKSVILEIRAGTGGEEAALFAGELLRMYAYYAEARGWRMETISSHPTGIGGFKEVICAVEGKHVYSRLKYESGVHRVQRVPETEAAGRIHTSAVTVAVLPEAEEVEVEIDAKDIRVDVMRSAGPGGQSVNTTDSAVRITHYPSGIVIHCQDEKSQIKNRSRAMKILRARLLAQAQEEQREKIEADRRSQVGSGDRSGKIRTYNFPQNRVTDHRIGLTIHRLDAILRGELDEFVDALATYHQAEALKASAGAGVE